ncbi:MAG: phosphoglucomutase/phosphomannomutase family protein [Dehalococcoidia bacterium]|nr:phosphoglucomutase/phosphomannomutase family protein [Dehalococcoidia bacterium]MSQ35380.1 phosphoglucomutase/phosphomannomutase family protein [Dehalococcoidia bacterium]
MAAPTHPTPSIRFGTDGWRARIADQFTFENVRACADGLARYIIANGQASKGAVAGFDTRFLSDKFAATVADVLASRGVPVSLFDRPAPTPACSLAVKQLGAAAGAMITASHNPAHDNGFKVKWSAGGSAPPEMVAAIEAEVYKVLAGQAPAINAPRAIVTNFNPVAPYIAQLERVVDTQRLRDAPLKIIVDAMHGTGAGILPAILKGGRVQITEIRSEHNPAFPGMQQPEPVEHNLAPLISEVRQARADVGIALDGDADRVGIVSEQGVYFSTLEVFSLLTHHLWGRRNEHGGVACTITQSSMLDRLAGKYGRKVERTAVGFKFVGPAMIANDCALGGEESGGYAFRGHIPERDGSLSGMLFLEAMVMSGKKPSALLEELHTITGPHTFRRIDLQFDEAKRDAVAARMKESSPESLGGLGVTSADRRDGVRFNLAGDAWAVARLSGTEPLVRLYAEAPATAARDRVLTDLRRLLGV